MGCVLVDYIIPVLLIANIVIFRQAVLQWFFEIGLGFVMHGHMKAPWFMPDDDDLRIRIQ